ncbi:aldo/keto reductase [Streptomyces sp. NPDC051561]|uniref:aldo/keto reductase n=1 Tax=Streptomyces sp. NPDC051561 TaxID=3365658 RepID=UPI0037B6F776
MGDPVSQHLLPVGVEAAHLRVVPYSSLGGGVLSGKYSRDDLAATSAGTGDSNRRSHNLTLGTLTERNLAVADVARGVAADLGRAPAQVALAWTLRNPGVATTLIGARTPAQLRENLGTLEIAFTTTQLTRLNEASAIELGQPHDLLASDNMRQVTTGGLRIETRR